MTNNSDSSETFINPVTMSLGLLDGYRILLVENLQKSRISEEDIPRICQTMEVDRGLFFSVNLLYLK